MKTWVVTAVFAAAATLHLVRAVRIIRENSPGASGEVLHALMGVAMAVMAWPAHGMVFHGWAAAALCQVLAVAFFLGAVWAALTRAPASCLMAFGMAIVFTPVE